MSAGTKHHQIIEHEGKPLFVLVPYEEYLRLTDTPPRDMDEKIYLPHDVAMAHSIDGKSLIRAWREYKKLSQKEVAERMGISQSAYSQMEKPEANLRRTSIAKLAAALEVVPEQLYL